MDYDSLLKCINSIEIWYKQINCNVSFYKEIKELLIKRVNLQNTYYEKSLKLNNRTNVVQAVYFVFQVLTRDTNEIEYIPDVSEEYVREIMKEEDNDFTSDKLINI